MANDTIRKVAFTVNNLTYEELERLKEQADLPSVTAAARQALETGLIAFFQPERIIPTPEPDLAPTVAEPRLGTAVQLDLAHFALLMIARNASPVSAPALDQMIDAVVVSIASQAPELSRFVAEMVRGQS